MTNVLEIYRGGEIIASIDIDTGAVFSEKLPGTDMISCPVLTKDVVDLQEEDYIFHKGNPYKIRILPDFGKDSSTIAKSYKIDFLAKFYDLIDIYVAHEGAHVFPYYGNARLQLEMCLSAANLNGTIWTIGDIEDTEDLLLKYDWTFVRPALDQIAEAFGLEWKAEGSTISMVKSVGRNTGLVFEIGRGKGLHQIRRSSDTSKEKLTRIYGIGGTTNIDSTYRNGTESNLVFEERFVETPGAAAGTERVRMGKYENPDIYPRFEGTITDVVYVTDSEGKITSCTITDPSIDFDVMAHMQEGVKGQVSFRTGPVTGIDFEISAASLSNKTITLVPFTDATGYYYPSATSQPEVGNKFTIIKMRMPNAYTIKAENELKEKSIIFLNDNKLQRIIYNAKPDESHLRNNMIALRAGDRVILKDYDFGINQVLRFTEISYPLVNEYDITAVIGNEIRYDRVAKLFADVIQNKQQIQEVDRRGAVIAKRNSQNLKQLADSIFDADGNLDATKFNVGVLMAILAQFGLMSSDFLLNKVFITANFGGDINAVNISAGELIHMEYTHGGTENIWQMQPLTISGLVPGNKYYVYSKISTTSNAGTFIVTTDQIKPNDNPGFYTLRTGIIYPVNDGYRDVDFTYGITSINGRQIRTGIIEGNTGALSLNLDTGDIFGKLTFRSSNGTIKDVAAVDQKSQLADANALAAQIIADAAMSQLAVYADNGILDTKEKVDTLQKYRIIQGDLATRIAQATTYGVSAGAYNNSFVALENYLIPLLANMAVDSPIDRDIFINYFKNYYNAESALLRAVTDAANSKINNISVGGRNYFRRDTPILQQNKPLQIIKTDRGFKVFGVSENDANARMYNVITKNGYWTISFDVSTSLTPWSDSFIDICDSVAYYFQTELAPNKHHVEITVNVTNYSAEVYNFIDFNRLSGQWYDFDNVMVENANVASGGWRAAPEDLQADLDLAISQSSEAMSKVAVITNDGILDTSEKVDLLKEYRGYYTEYPIKIAQAATFAVPTAEYTSAYDQLVNYVDNVWLLANGQNTPVDRGEFYNVYNFYFYARENLLRNITNAANGKINNVSFGGVNLLNNTAKFTQAAGNWTGVEYRPDSIGPADSFDGILSSTLYGNIFSGGVYYAPQVILKPNTVYTYSAMLWLSNGSGDYSPIWPMHYWLGNTYNNNHYDVASLVIDKDQTVIAQTWKKYWVTFKTPNVANSLYFRPYIYGGGNINAANFTEVLLEASSRPGTYKPSLSDLYAQAAAIADTIAQSKANIAQAAAIGAAQADAQSRAENAFNNAVAASNIYAQTAANNASSAAQIAAAADASNKATQAYNDAVANANAIYTQLTNSLKGLAYQEFVEVSKLGSTVVDNGRIKTVLIDAQGIWANIINAGFITAQQIEALNIAVTNLNAVSGTIGGLTISNNSVYSSNGNFSLTSDGALTVKSGQIGGFNIGTSELTSGNFVLSPSKNAAYFSENINGAVVASIGRVKAVIPNSPYDAPGVFMNELTQYVGENVALVVSAKNGALRNIALDIPNGSIRSGGNIPFTGYKTLGGNIYDKYHNGLFIGQGQGTNF
jgi:hypothetical protein